MRTTLNACSVILAVGFSVATLHADCPYDHLLLGQQEGTLFLDLSQLYRHWNVDWGTNPDPYGQNYYEFTAMYGGGQIRVEPGISDHTDPQYALDGVRGEDHSIQLQRVHASPGLELYDDTMDLVLATDGATLSLASYPNHHVHMRYHLPEGLDAARPYVVSYRLKDAMGGYADSDIYTFFLGAEPHPGDTDLDGDVDSVDLAALGLNWSPGGLDGTWAGGDFDSDGDVDAADLATLGLEWAPGGVTVPEPSSLLLLGLGSLALLRRRASNHTCR